MIYLALHIITESMDHYHKLYEIPDLSDTLAIKDLIVNSISETPEYWYSVHIETNNKDYNKLISNIIDELRYDH